MKKHKHDALIREWLDNGMPQVESSYNGSGTWNNIDNPSWHENYEYRLVYPPKPKKQIKMLCWLVGNGLAWYKEGGTVGYDWKRVPLCDQVIEVEE